MNALNLTIKAAAKLLNFDRRVVSGMCDRGELGFVPCRTPDGGVSRVHRRIPLSELEAWNLAHTVRGPEEFRKAVDGRRR